MLARLQNNGLVEADPTRTPPINGAVSRYIDGSFDRRGGGRLFDPTDVDLDSVRQTCLTISLRPKIVADALDREGVARGRQSSGGQVPRFACAWLQRRLCRSGRSSLGRHGCTYGSGHYSV